MEIKNLIETLLIKIVITIIIIIIFIKSHFSLNCQ